MRPRRTPGRRLACAVLGASMSPLLLASPAMAQDADAGRPLAALNPLAALTLDDAPNFAGKPLFSASRRPPPDAFVPTAQPAPPPPAPPSAAGLQLIGTVRTRDGTMARIQDSASGSTQSVKPGDLIGGWKVTSIEAAAVQLEQSGTVETLDLFSGEARAPSLADLPPAMPAPTASSTPLDGGASTIQPSATTSNAPAAPGTVAGTAAAEAAANSTARLVFGTAAPADPNAPAESQTD